MVLSHTKFSRSRWGSRMRQALGKRPYRRWNRQSTVYFTSSFFVPLWGQWLKLIVWIQTHVKHGTMLHFGQLLFTVDLFEYCTNTPSRCESMHYRCIYRSQSKRSEHCRQCNLTMRPHCPEWGNKTECQYRRYQICTCWKVVVRLNDTSSFESLWRVETFGSSSRRN